ncbi:hypothetical protein JIG36_47500 [Actinoplanes sp. LDG1-06]|uniref:Uncharacterized protein n=1 Tax=Paractinoplanes ovalisporus TaxID=2810368 RepID=A0ABS2ATM2_9ACTN|nr:hypothetical protein [Actinoplanes ovalisporus]MBM2623169.1 hypothetical protein [Actinoplanes ovalisporus]
MSLVRVLQDEEHWPHFSTIVVTEGFGSDDDLLDWPEGPDDFGFDVGFGTAGRAGTGWLWITAGDGPHHVTLEVHDAAPGIPGAEWPQVWETPYRSVTGSVGLSTMTDGPARETVDLQGRGAYRLQVCSRWDGDSGVWSLRWWPCSPEEPPRWIRRGSDQYATPKALAEDVAALIAWSPRRRVTCTTAELADRLALAPTDMRTAVNLAVRSGWINLDGSLHGDTAVTVHLSRQVS